MLLTKEIFIKLVSDYTTWSKRLDQVSDTLNAPELFICDWVSYGSSLFEYVIQLFFTEEGVDHIDWWIYEKNNNPDLKMWDKNENEIPTDTVEDLWNIVKDYLK